MNKTSNAMRIAWIGAAAVLLAAFVALIPYCTKPPCQNLGALTGALDYPVDGNAEPIVMLGTSHAVVAVELLEPAKIAARIIVSDGARVKEELSIQNGAAGVIHFQRHILLSAAGTLYLDIADPPSGTRYKLRVLGCPSAA